MRRNIFLRAALLLLIGAWASSTVFTGTWAKYYAAGTGTASARFASFSFITSGQKYLGGGGWGTVNGNIGNALTDHWTEIVTESGITATQTFQLPLFDYEYYGSGAHSGDITVRGKNKEIVIAPGMGWSEGTQATNPNFGGNWSAPFSFRNNSEVRLRFKVELDQTSSLAGVTLFLGPVHSAPAPYVASAAFPGVLIGPSALSSSITMFNDSAHADGWYYLNPTDTATFSMYWLWFFDAGHAGWIDAFSGSPGYRPSDTVDTQLGKSSGYVNLIFKVTVEQVD